MSAPHIFKAFIFIVSLSAFPAMGAADLSSGPMVGHLAHREANIWVQTSAAAEVAMRYRPSEGSAPTRETAPVKTTNENGFTAVLVADQVDPGTTYRYTILIDGRELTPNGPQQFTTPSAFWERAQPPAFRVALGGAHHTANRNLDPPYRELGGGYSIFERIAEAAPDLMIWAGDGVTLRRADLSSRSGIQRRYTESRAHAELRTLLGSIPHYAAWGRRDFGPPRADHRHGSRSWTSPAFADFWANPPSVTPHSHFTQFVWGDAEFFILDINSFRDGSAASVRTPAFLGEAQLNWLRSSLHASEATFKIIVAGTSLLNPARVAGDYSSVREEHDRFVQMLREVKVPGLFFVGGGKGYGEFTRFVHSGSYDFHELTLGPLTATAEARGDEINFFRQPGTYTEVKHFGLLEFDGPEDARRLTIRVMDVDGEELWNRTLEYSQMQN